DTLHLTDLLKYELVVIGGESARTDDIGNDLIYGGILDTLCSYLAMGGKMVVFSRWGELGSNPARPLDTVYCEPGTPKQGYLQYFNMDYRVRRLSLFTQTLLNSDLIGAHSLDPAYPELTWDSLATIDHSSPWIEATGIPCPVVAHLVGDAEVLYTYVSRDNSPLTHGKPVAWRYLGDDYQYVFFAVPLSFMNRTEGIAALQAAVSELVSSGPAGTTTIEPDTVDLSGNPPATVDIYLGDFVSGMSAGDVDVAGIRINSSVSPAGTVIIPSKPPFTGEVLQITAPTDSFVATYSDITDTANKGYTVSWTFAGETKRDYALGQVVLIGQDFKAGDANGDGNVNIGDAVYLISYIFRGGPSPQPLEAGDANCNHAINVGDAVYIVNYVFRNGPEPCYP
ncbi:MAG: dockerin type I repeat-containing protein, partial [candidate division Zixibacteria bacterium]|nr:dockerin type I repeat-containing protein [candidate division Zixibacteria bacterium]